MRATHILILFIAFGTLLFSCKKIDGGGTIKEQGITTYTYGTHIIDINGTTYAVKSNHVNLNDYLDEYVTIHAEKVDGYPVDGGPELLEVISIN